MAQNAYQNVLIVTDQTAVARTILEVLAARGARGVLLSDPPAARRRLADCEWELAIIDLAPEAGGEFPLLDGLRQAVPETPVVMMGPASRADLVVRALRAGCDEYLLQPLSREAVTDLLAALLPAHPVPQAVGDLEGGDPPARPVAWGEDARCLYRIAGASRPLLEVVHLATRVAPTSVPVLIMGESGTGKELLSYLVHRASRRSSGPYIRVNCAALSESLLESELFGHERGAFTGAFAQRKGRFERASGGTLLLDEISETTPRLQAKLLRVLEQQDFERVGGSEAVRVNVRVVSTSNRDLAADVEAGRFRRDLYYRLGCVRLTIPPLRDRPEDIPALVWHFVNLYAPEVRRRIETLDEGMLDLFGRHAWPGNVRQLRNVVRSALILGEGTALSLAGAPALRRELESSGAAPAASAGLYVIGDGAGGGAPHAAAAPTLSLQDLERQAVLEALRRTQRNQLKAARLLGITDRTLREKLRRYRRDGLLQTAGESA